MTHRPEHEILGLTSQMTTSPCVYAKGAFAIHSLRFFLHSAPITDLPVQKAPRESRIRAAGAPSLLVFCARVGATLHLRRRVPHEHFTSAIQPLQVVILSGL